MFNPRPRVQTFPIDDRHACYVIDDVLSDPGALVAYATARRAQFAMGPVNAFPGLELRMPDGFSAGLDDFFRLHVRSRLGARRTQSMYSRLSMVTLAPEQLRPTQMICHRDLLQFAPNQVVAASVLYLFNDERLGGTSFFAPRRPIAEMNTLYQQSTLLDADEFVRRHGLARGYMTGSNYHFRELLTVPPRWNRIIFYDGGVLHSGRITHPERLSDDPSSGRLTLNGFFTCSKAAAA